MSVKNSAPAKSPVVAAPVPAVKSRTSRLPTTAVLEALRAAGPTGLTVPAMAAALKVEERDVRLSIDKLRVLKFPVVRCAKLTFALSA